MCPWLSAIQSQSAWGIDSALIILIKWKGPQQMTYYMQKSIFHAIKFESYLSVAAMKVMNIKNGEKSDEKWQVWMEIVGWQKKKTNLNRVEWQ